MIMSKHRCGRKPPWYVMTYYSNMCVERLRKTTIVIGGPRFETEVYRATATPSCKQLRI
jgi:hypothetical protein